MNLKVILAVAIILTILGGVAFTSKKQTWKKNQQMMGQGMEGQGACGKFGDVTACAKSSQPVMVGENSAIYALHSGTLHDPNIKRECSMNPPLLCGGKDMEYSFKGNGSTLSPALIGTGNELGDVYGAGGNARERLMKGTPCASC